MKNKIVDLTSEMIKIKSTKGNYQGLKASIDFIETFFKNDDVFIRRYEYKGKPAIIVTLQDTMEPDVFLVGHQDVVEAEEHQFIPYVKDGKLFGRGACDMKNGNAIMMLLMQYFAHQENKPSLGAMFTTDEEIGGKDGAKYLLKQGYRCKVCLIPDGGELHDHVATKAKGILELKLIAKGKAVHGSRPWDGDNAIEKLMEAYQLIKKNFPILDVKDHWHETVNLGRIEGGTASNRVPDIAHMELDFRFTEKFTPQSLTEKVRAIVGENVDVEMIASGNPIFNDLDNPYLVQYLQVNREVLGKEPVLCVEHSATDGRHFVEYAIPVIVQQPDRANYHGLDEYTVIDTLEPIYEIYKKFVERVGL